MNPHRSASVHVSIQQACIAHLFHTVPVPHARHTEMSKTWVALFSMKVQCGHRDTNSPGTHTHTIPPPNYETVWEFRESPILVGHGSPEGSTSGLACRSAKSLEEMAPELRLGGQVSQLEGGGWCRGEADHCAEGLPILLMPRSSSFRLLLKMSPPHSRSF